MIILLSKLLGDYNLEVVSSTGRPIILLSKLLGDYNLKEQEELNWDIILLSKLLGDYNLCLAICSTAPLYYYRNY